jgi:hypothetical protein
MHKRRGLHHSLPGIRRLVILLLPILLIVHLILLNVVVRGNAVLWSLGDEFRLVLVLSLTLLGAEEAKSPIREVEAAEDDESGEGLGGRAISESEIAGGRGVDGGRVVVDFFDFVRDMVVARALARGPVTGCTFGMAK